MTCTMSWLCISLVLKAVAIKYTEIKNNNHERFPFFLVLLKKEHKQWWSFKQQAWEAWADWIPASLKNRSFRCFFSGNTIRQFRISYCARKLCEAVVEKFLFSSVMYNFFYIISLTRKYLIFPVGSLMFHYVLGFFLSE